MSTDVKGRPYNSPARRRQAAVTRARVLAAAEELFLAHGYTATTTAAIARVAGVSEASVFVAFGSKSSLLVAVVGAAVAGSADQVMLREQPEWRRLGAVTDGRKAVATFVGFARGGHERTWRLLGMVRAAAESDSELAALAARAARARRADCEWFVTEVLGRPAGDTRTAHWVDVLWTQTSVDVYRLLVVELGWTTVRYESWLVELLCRELDAGLG
ncbi:MAG: hypothetical protein NVS3B18_05580 [Candidatus Dormibacteria bacterium]